MGQTFDDRVFVFGFLSDTLLAAFSSSSVTASVCESSSLRRSWFSVSLSSTTSAPSGGCPSSARGGSETAPTTTYAGDTHIHP